MKTTKTVWALQLAHDLALEKMSQFSFDEDMYAVYRDACETIEELLESYGEKVLNPLEEDRE